MSENSQPYSYHTFFFPFLWNDGGSKITRKDFAKCLGENWIKETNTPDTMTIAKLDEQYNQFHYFNAAARNAIYTDGGEKAVVWNYRYSFSGFAQDQEGTDWLHQPKTQHNPAKYVIKKNRIVELSINGIRLKLFNTGIGILIFELENYQYPHPDDITWINDYGRRIYMPFSSNGKCSDCATRISLKYNQTVLSSDILIGKPESFDSTRLAAPILYLLQNGSYAVTADSRQRDKHTFFIEPIIDDRMFVACYYRNMAFTNYVSAWDNGQYGYLQDAENKEPDDPENRASLVYRMMFVDGSFTSCQSRPMMKRLLEEHIYDRWIEYGTITGITEYSMVSVTGGDADFLARNFLTEYVEMMILVLAQRASLLAFERMISDSATGKLDIRTIQKRYILFQSQLLLKEVTPQQQGIELYSMLLKNMFIPEQTSEIENQIEALFAQKTSRSEARENLILFFLAILGIFEAVDYLLTWVFPSSNSLIKVGVSCLLSILAVVWYAVNRRR